MTTDAPFLKGTLDVLVLKALAWTPMHGFELARWLEARSGEAFELDEAAIYQALRPHSAATSSRASRR